MAPSVNGLESQFYLVHGRDLLEGRLSHLQNYWRYIGEQPGRLAVQELRKMWKTHVHCSRGQDRQNLKQIGNTILPRT